MTDGQDVEPRAHSTILTGRKEDISFEMWVEVDGKPLEVYGEAEMESGGSEAWIASEIGKVCFSTELSPIGRVLHEFGTKALTIIFTPS